MNVREVREIGERWLAEELGRDGEIVCAFTGGSINRMAEGASFPESSDLDLVLVVPHLDPVRHRTEKRAYGGIAIEPFYVPLERFRSADELLADFGLCPHALAGRVLHDPQGFLERVRPALAAGFARRRWIRARWQAVRQHTLPWLDWGERDGRLLQVNAVSFHAIQGLAQMALIADLADPTVKKALVKAKDVFAAYQQEERHRSLLRLLGADGLDDDAVLAMAGRCLETLDAACACLRTPFEGDNAVSVHALPSLQLEVPACVAAGAGREIALWVASLYTFALHAIENDGPQPLASAARERYLADMMRMSAATEADALARVRACRAALDEMEGVCEAIVAANPREG
jgi:hypothetical protein